MTRAPKLKYQFHKRRAGDVIIAPTSRHRAYYLSAFANWKRDKPGTLKASSQKTETGYRIEFSGISPAEITAAEIGAKEDI